MWGGFHSVCTHTVLILQGPITRAATALNGDPDGNVAVR